MKVERESKTGIRELIKAAKDESRRCRCCPWECKVDRSRGERGRCGAADPGEVFYAGLLMNEESILNPAYEVFFTGCNLDCAFCYLHDKVTGRGTPLDHHSLHHDPALREAASLCAVGGEPSVNLAAALEFFAAHPVRPRVWNTNLIYSGLVREAVAEVCHVVVGDLHFGNDQCALRLSGFPRYLETALENLERARAAGVEVMVRHLVLPGHEECCGREVARLVAHRLGPTRFTVLDNYLPPAPARTGRAPELGSRVRPGAAERLREEAEKLGLLLEPTGPGAAAVAPVGSERSEIVIDEAGTVSVLHLTPGLWEALAAMGRQG